MIEDNDLEPLFVQELSGLHLVKKMIEDNYIESLFVQELSVIPSVKND